MVSDFDYELPESLIAQKPLKHRAESILFDVAGLSHEVGLRRFRDISKLVGPGDLMVVNDSKVIPARLRLVKETGGRVEIFLVERVNSASGPPTWLAMAKPMKRIAPGDALYAPEPLAKPSMSAAPGSVVSVIGRDDDSGLLVVQVDDPDELARLGEMPLPPYIRSTIDDPARYQTVYARNPGSVAAPTAGLHFTPELIDDCIAAGANVARIELAVGLGTFKPVTAERPQDHIMHSEAYVIPAETISLIDSASRVIAVGTTTLRALESYAATGLIAGRTDLFIHGTYEFKIVDVLVTNFHQPRSTLLMLLDSFIGGHGRWRSIYQEAMRRELRFLSFGDAMVVRRGGGTELNQLPRYG